MSIAQCIILEIPDTLAMIAYTITTEYFWNFQSKSCIVGML